MALVGAVGGGWRRLAQKRAMVGVRLAGCVVTTDPAPDNHNHNYNHNHTNNNHTSKWRQAGGSKWGKWGKWGRPG